MLIVPRDSLIKDVADLEGKIVALPPAQAAVSELIKVLLLDAGLLLGNSITLNHLGSHFACMQAIVNGSASACGTGLLAIRIYERMGLDHFRILERAQAICPPLFIVHPSMPPDVAQQIEDVLLSWDGTPRMRHLLNLSDGMKPFVPATDSGYDSVRRLIERLKR